MNVPQLKLLIMLANLQSGEMMARLMNTRKDCRKCIKTADGRHWNMCEMHNTWGAMLQELDKLIKEVGNGSSQKS